MRVCFSLETLSYRSIPVGKFPICFQGNKKMISFSDPWMRGELFYSCLALGFPKEKVIGIGKKINFVSPPPT
jgi:hypothetical protein